MITLRPATVDDFCAVLTLERTCPGAAHWDEQEYRRILSGRTAAPRHITVAEQDGLIGFIVVRNVGSEWEIENIAVADQVRRRSIGSQLVRHIVDFARTSGGAAIYLEVRESNVAARTLYERCGFTKTGRRSEYYSDPLEDAIEYRHQLSGVFSKPVEGEKTLW